MNIFDLANIRLTKGVIMDRTERIKREGSKPYVWTPGIIATTASVAIHVPTQFPDSRKYQPLNSLEIVNNEAVNDLTITINGSESRLVPASTIRAIHGDGVALWHIAITNNGGVNTTAGAIVLTLQKEPLTMDKWIRGR